MEKRRIYTWLSVGIMFILGMNLTISTLHSHHDLELHNSPEIPDTGQCLSADTTLCPICAHILQTENPSDFGFADIFFDITEIIEIQRNEPAFSPFYNISRGRSPPTA